MKNIFLVKNCPHLPQDKINQSNCMVINLDTLTGYNDVQRNAPETPILYRVADKPAFEKAYRDLIASLGQKHQSMYWWASCLSEKNAFTSKIFQRLYKLACLDADLRTDFKGDVTVICSDDVILKQIWVNYRKRFMVYYPFLSNISGEIRKIINVCTGFLKQINIAVDECVKLLSAGLVLLEKKAKIKKNKDYIVLRTWVDHRNYKSDAYDDSYFKNLPNFLSGNNQKVLIAAGIISDYYSIIQKFKGDIKNFIIPVNFYLKGIDILSCLCATCFKRTAIKGNIHFYGFDITCLVAAELNSDIVTTHFFSALLQYYACRRLAEAISIKEFIYTFENYSWEKMSILGLRSQNPKIKIVGFQHAFIAKNSFIYFPGAGDIGKMPLPDKIVTMGKRTQEIMKRFGNYPEGIFSVGCALRQEYLFNLTILPRNRNGGIFVPLTITIEDTVKVLNFIFEAGLGQCSEKIYLRFHPATPIEKVIKMIRFSLPRNFIISDNAPMLKEMERCSVVLYTWTTVCLEALNMGRPVIYLDVNYPLEVDPLFECDSLKDVCREPGNLIAKIEKLRNMDDKVFMEQMQKARGYLNDYFSPVNQKALSNFIIA